MSSESNGQRHGVPRRKRFAVFAAVLLGFLGAVACTGGGPVGGETGGNGPGSPGPKMNGSDPSVQAVATTGMITDIVRQVGGDRVAVVGLMGPGVDPHLYHATQGDIGRLQRADIIFYNGLVLEGKMADIFVKMAREKPTIAVTEKIDEQALRTSPSFPGHVDPHVWMDVELWMAAVERVTEGLTEIDPAGATLYRDRAAAYRAELQELDAWVHQRVSEIPEPQRVLVTAHDAFGYFGDAYGFEVVGLQGISTEAEYGLRDVQNLVDFLVERNIKAVFIETSVPPEAIQAVVEGARSAGHEVRIGGELFSDALGEAGTPEGTYIGMIRHNVNTIVDALK